MLDVGSCSSRGENVDVKFGVHGMICHRFDCERAIIGLFFCVINHSRS